MWTLIFCLLFQDPTMPEAEAINAQVYLPNGKLVEMVDIKIRGARPYEFELNTGGETRFVSLLRVVRMTRSEDNRTFEVMFDDGRILTGRINSFTMSGRPVVQKDTASTAITGNLEMNASDEEVVNILHVDRVHIISGNQLRACAEGHYEAYTPHPFCPVCGRELVIGPYAEEVDYRLPALPRTHRLRLDPRDPSGN